MYAVIATGGKQYKVAHGERIKIETLAAEPGSTVEFDQVLLVAQGDDVKVGSPLVENAKVNAEVIGDGRAKKVKIIKFRRRKHHMKHMGHRQDYTEVKITGFVVDGKEVKVESVVEAETKKVVEVKAEPKSEKPMAAKTKEAATVATEE